MKVMKIRITYTEELLGTASANPTLHEEFIASKAPDAKSREEEVAAIGVDEAIDKAMTVFPRLDDGTPFLWNYQIKGYFKESCAMLRRVPGTRSSKFRAYKKEIDGLLFPEPRKIPLQLPAGGMIGSCQRPLRASTAQGERVALANSETVPAGTTCEFEVALLSDSMEGLVREWLDYGKLHGMGQWRNSGKGSFTHEVLLVADPSARA